MGKEIGILIFLGINAWIDIRKRRISLFTAAVFLIAGIIFLMCEGRDVKELLLTLSVVLFFLGFSIFSKGAFGLGDVWVLLGLCVMLETEKFFTVLCISMLLASGWSMILLVFLHKNGKTEFPFVPFLLLGYVGGMLIW